MLFVFVFLQKLCGEPVQNDRWCRLFVAEKKNRRLEITIFQCLHASCVMRMILHRN